MNARRTTGVSSRWSPVRRRLACATLMAAVAAPTLAQDSNLYNPDYLPDEVREQLERSRSGDSSSNDAARQRYEDVMRSALGGDTEPAQPQERTSDADRAMQMLEVLQQTLEQKDRSRREEPRYAPPPREPDYAPPADYRGRPASPAQPTYTPPRQPAAPAPPSAPSRYLAPPAPATPPACPAGTTKDTSMEQLGLPSCCDAQGQCF